MYQDDYLDLYIEAAEAAARGGLSALSYGYAADGVAASTSTTRPDKLVEREDTAHAFVTMALELSGARAEVYAVELALRLGLVRDLEDPRVGEIAPELLEKKDEPRVDYDRRVSRFKTELDNFRFYLIPSRFTRE